MRCHLRKEHHIFPLLRAKVDQAPLLDKASPQPYIQTTSDQELWTIPQEDPAHPTIVPNLLTPSHCDNGSSLISHLRCPQPKTRHFSGSPLPNASFSRTSSTWPQTAGSRTRGASEHVGALSPCNTPPSTSSASMEQGAHDGGAGWVQRHAPPSKSPQTPSCRKAATTLKKRSPIGKDVGGLTAPLLQFWWTHPTLPSSTPIPPPRPSRHNTGTTLSCRPSTSTPQLRPRRHALCSTHQFGHCSPHPHRLLRPHVA